MNQSPAQIAKLAMHRVPLIAIALLLAVISTANAATYQQLHTFTGGPGTWGPGGKPLLIGSTIYGSYSEDLFRIQTDGTGYETVHTFGGPFPANLNGSSPMGALAYDGARIYGTTSSGGAGDQGVVYAINPAGGTPEVLASLWTGQYGMMPGGVVLSGGVLFGSTGAALGSTAIYRLDVDGSNFQTILQPDHSSYGYRSSQLRVDGSTIYGAMSNYSGDSGGGRGNLYAIETDGSNFRRLHEFSGGPDDGDSPFLGALSQVGNTLYGTTAQGGDSDEGIVFKLNTDGTGFEILHEFSGLDGSDPSSVAVVGDRLIGIADLGGAHGGGSIFSLALDGSDFETVHDFPAGGDFNISLGLTVDGNTAYGFYWKFQSGGGELFSVTVPEPSSVLLATLGLLAILPVVRRRVHHRV